MTEHQATPAILASSSEPAPVTIEQFNAFVAANAPEKPCHECGTTDWGIPGETDADFKGFMADEVTRNGREYYTITCRHCGFAKLFAADVVERWVGSNHDG